MDATEKRLTALRQKIDDALVEKAQQEGALATLKAQLKRDFGCDTLAEARTKLQTLDNELAKLDKQLAEGLLDLERQLAGAGQTP